MFALLVPSCCDKLLSLVTRLIEIDNNITVIDNQFCVVYVILLIYIGLPLITKFLLLTGLPCVNKGSHSNRAAQSVVCSVCNI